MGSILPGDAELQTQWILNSINHSTKGLARGGLSAHVSSQVFNLLKGMRPGLEASHLQSLFTLLDMRGSDVKLDTVTVVEGGRQLVPYPAIAWDWKSIQSYRWQTPQHINVLELLAFFNYIRAWTVHKDARSVRFFHVLDSRVSSCVIAKGRSSSKLLNRILRRVCALTLVADLYVLPLWTVSSWNFSDPGSRAVATASSTHAG